VTCASRVVTTPGLYLNAAKRVRTYVRTYIHTYIHILSTIVTRDSHIRVTQDRTWHILQINSLFISQNTHTHTHGERQMHGQTNRRWICRSQHKKIYCINIGLLKRGFQVTAYLKIKVTLKVSTLGFHAGITAQKFWDSYSSQHVWLEQYTTISYETSIQSRGNTTSIHWRFMHDDILQHFLLH
jgi:hypothetical protein